MGFVFNERFWLLQWQKQPYTDGRFENNHVTHEKYTEKKPVLESKFIKTVTMKR